MRSPPGADDFPREVFDTLMRLRIAVSGRFDGLRLDTGSERIAINFRKGKVVGKVAANDRSRVTEFADHIVEQIPAN